MGEKYCEEEGTEGIKMVQARMASEQALPGATGSLSCYVVGNSERSAAFGATAGENLTTVFSGHTLAETVLVDPSAVGGLERSFHFMKVFIDFRIRTAKLENDFDLAKSRLIFLAGSVKKRLKRGK